MPKDDCQRVRVGIRIRPLSEREVTNGAQNVLNVRNKTGIHCHIPSRQNNFNFDWAFGPEDKQMQVYTALSDPILENIFEGINATILAYGQTGSGKTHTIGGGDCTADATDSLESEDFGFIPRVVRDIFSEVESRRTSNPAYSADIQMSYMEVYKEDCFDLLAKERPKVELRESSRGEVLVENLTRLGCGCAADIHRKLQEANRGRATSATLMNTKSSRSHAILTLYLKVTRPMAMDMEAEPAAAAEPVAAGDMVTLASRLNVVDLAGSERVKKTGASGDTLKEGIAINQGLLALGNVIEALSKKSLLSADANDMHIPYRDAKITRLLKDSLGGNNVTVLLACVSPADLHSEETMNTLRFASRAMEVINKAHANAELAAGTGGGYISKEDGDRMGLEILNLKMEVLKYQKVIAQLEQQELAGGGVGAGVMVKAAAGGAASGTGAGAFGSGSYLVQETHRSYYQLCRLLSSVLTSCIEENILLDEAEIEQYVAVIKKMTALYSGVRGGVTSDALLRLRVTDMQAGAVDEMELMLPVLLRCVEEVDALAEAMCAVHGFGASAEGKGSDGSDAGTHSMDLDCPDIGGALPDGESMGGRSGRSSDASEGSVGSADQETDLHLPPDAQTAELESKLSSKMERVTKINSFLSDFESNMATLKAEISTLQTDKLQIFNSIKAAGPSAGAKPLPASSAAVAGSSRPSYMQSTKGSTTGQSHARPSMGHAPHSKPFGVNAGSSSSSSSASASQQQSQASNPKVVERLRSDLSSKSRLLEEKLRELKAKETEYRAVSAEKRQVDREVGSLRGQFEALQAKRVALVSQLREEKSSFQQEKKRLVQAEQQCKKRERSVVHNLAKLEHEVGNKERVWRSQLEAKERETKRLKDLIQKQTVVREMRAGAHGGSGDDGGSGSGVASVTENNNYYTRRHQGDIKTQVLRLLNQEKLKTNYTEEIALECKLRSQAARQMNMLKSKLKLEALSGGGGGWEGGEAEGAVQKEVALLESEVQSRSALILARQGALADLEGSRQASCDSHWDALCKTGADYKLAMSTMLSHVTAATNQQALQAKAYEAKIAQQNAEIRRLRAGIGGVGMGVGRAAVSGGPRPSEASSGGGGKTSSLPRKPGLPAVFRRAAQRQLSGDSVERLDGDDSEEEDEEEGDEFDSEDALESDEDEEAEDVDTEDEYVPGHTPHKARGAFSKRKRPNPNPSRDDDGDEESVPRTTKRRVLQDITEGAPSDYNPKMSAEDELRQLTVPLLKERCKVHGLPVSGRKDDLVARLVAAGDCGGSLETEADGAGSDGDAPSPASESAGPRGSEVEGAEAKPEDPLAGCRSFYNGTKPQSPAPAGAAALPPGRVKLAAAVEQSKMEALDQMLLSWTEAENINTLNQ